MDFDKYEDKQQLKLRKIVRNFCSFVGEKWMRCHRNEKFSESNDAWLSRENEQVSNHGSIPINLDYNVVAFIVFEEGFHQPIKRIKQWNGRLRLDDCTPVVSRSFKHRTGDSTILLGSPLLPPILWADTLGVVRDLPPLFPFHQSHMATVA
ncbi:hypothetical protein TNCV_844311 [Trichonephila clavipes]|nr:hypothetical protein TNCV_844311 [Trichonephila clavipes]